MQNTNIRKSRVVKDSVFTKILEDQKLRDILMEVTGLREPGVRSIGYRKSQKGIKDEDRLNAIREYTGWTDDEIFETESEAESN